MPFLHLGDTRYRPLDAIEGMDSLRVSTLASNVSAYQKDARLTQKNLTTMLAELDLAKWGITDLPTVCQSAKNKRLLRYPLLIESGLRDPMYEALLRAGLGPSRMYPTVLPKIPGLESLLSQQGEFPAATSFAERLLTLPTHPQVSQADVAKMHQRLLC